FAHAAYARLGEIARTMAGVMSTKSLGNERLNWFAEQLVPRVAKQFFRLCVDQNNLTGIVDDDHRIGRRFQKAPELRLRATTFRNIADRGADQRPFRGLERAQADLDRKFLAAL